MVCVLQNVEKKSKMLRAQVETSVEKKEKREREREAASAKRLTIHQRTQTLGLSNPREHFIGMHTVTKKKKKW